MTHNIPLDNMKNIANSKIQINSGPTNTINSNTSSMNKYIRPQSTNIPNSTPNRTTSSIYNLLHATTTTTDTTDQSNNNNNNNTSLQNTETKGSSVPLNIPSQTSNLLQLNIASSVPAPTITTTTNNNNDANSLTHIQGTSNSNIIPPLKNITTNLLNGNTTPNSIQVSTSTPSPSLSYRLTSYENNNIHTDNNPNTTLPSLIHYPSLNMSKTFHNQLPLLNKSHSTLNSTQYNNHNKEENGR